LQIDKGVYGAAQPEVAPYYLRKIWIPLLSEAFQQAIEECFVSSVAQRHQAISSYTQAETLLLRELGLEGWQPPEPLAYQSTFRQAWGDGRLDAEFFKPRYSALQQKLSQDFDLKTLGELGQVLKGVTASYYDNGTVPIIRSGDLTDISDDERFLRTHPTEAVFPLEWGDVLISSIGFGSIGKVQVFDKDGTYGTVSEVTVVRQNKINPYYLAFFLRSAFGQMQIEHYITGATGQLHLYPKDVARILIPDISEGKQQEYEHLALAAATARRQAKQLLEAAKRAVEVAIEDSEEAALALLAARSSDGSGTE